MLTYDKRGAWLLYKAFHAHVERQALRGRKPCNGKQVSDDGAQVVAERCGYLV